MGDWVTDSEHARHHFVLEERAEDIIECGLISRQFLLLDNILSAYLQELASYPIYYGECVRIGDVDSIRSSANYWAIFLVQVAVKYRGVSFGNFPCAIER